MFLDDQQCDGNKEVCAAYSIDYASLSSYSSSMDQKFCECDRAVRMDYPFQYKECTKEYNRGNHIDILGSCNGLICMGNLTDLDYATNLYKNGSICIWNPSTREYKKIQVPGRHFDLYSKSTFNIRYGFGYDCIINDYKVVRISGSGNPGGLKTEVYQLRSSAWNCTETKSYKFPYERRSRGLLFNGALHWLGVAITQETSTEVIMSFDISNERIVDVPLPEEAILHLGSTKARKNLRMLSDCLCSVINLSGTRTDIWVMQELGVRESWRKQFTISRKIVDEFR
ncbi:F-box/kelch-repeat protein At3g06240-like [Papaver somniferum]|uniref:F-box/kelch-repeat protein At3g06240-like n=1 Tax=Papaver somniferum TaxID=3469 RepID=UPI000E6F97B5|nr:F-box/kelch-repeat protein At3g06240-like [Papaver somniferum]